jgi:hypothetical protein
MIEVVAVSSSFDVSSFAAQVYLPEPTSRGQAASPTQDIKLWQTGWSIYENGTRGDRLASVRAFLRQLPLLGQPVGLSLLVSEVAIDFVKSVRHYRVSSTIEMCAYALGCLGS